VLVTGEAIELRLPTVEWTAETHAPAERRLWRRLMPTSQSDAALAAEIERARSARATSPPHCRVDPVADPTPQGDAASGLIREGSVGGSASSRRLMSWGSAVARRGAWVAIPVSGRVWRSIRLGGKPSATIARLSPRSRSESPGK
jgi:hypothetical protein